MLHATLESHDPSEAANQNLPVQISVATSLRDQFAHDGAGARVEADRQRVTLYAGKLYPLSKVGAARSCRRMILTSGAQWPATRWDVLLLALESSRGLVVSNARLANLPEGASESICMDVSSIDRIRRGWRAVIASQPGG
jgi:hypothetical protein